MTFHGTELRGDDFVPTGARAGLLIVHGMAEHRVRYTDAVQRFTDKQIACFTFDLRGHGESPGNRADIRSFQSYVDDLLAIRDSIHASHPTLPLFMWAHSLGSIVAIRSVELSDAHFRGVITSGCPIDAFPSMPSPIRGALVALATPFRRMLVNPGLPAEDLSHDTAVQASYTQDPLVPDKVTVRLLIELEAACRAALAEAGAITVPWLALHGEADNIAPPEGSRKLVESLGSKDKTLKLFAGMRHEVHNEIEPAATEFYGQVIHWIESRAV
jgi:acylglycerol lipase